MTYPCHRVFINDVKSEYNRSQQSVDVMMGDCVQCGGRVTTECWHRARAAAGHPVCLHTAVWSSHLSDTLQQTCKQGFTMSRI